MIDAHVRDINRQQRILSQYSFVCKFVHQGAQTFSTDAFFFIFYGLRGPLAIWRAVTLHTDSDTDVESWVMTDNWWQNAIMYLVLFFCIIHSCSLSIPVMVSLLQVLY